MKVTLIKKDCIGCGSCAAVCPDFFEMTDDGKSSIKKSKKVGDNEVLEVKKEGCIKEAADICPTQCIKVE